MKPPREYVLDHFNDVDCTPDENERIAATDLRAAVIDARADVIEVAATIACDVCRNPGFRAAVRTNGLDWIHVAPGHLTGQRCKGSAIRSLPAEPEGWKR